MAKLPDLRHLDLLFRTTRGAPIDPNYYRGQHYNPAISPAFIKFMSPGQFNRLLLAVPSEYRLPLKLLQLGLVSMDTVRFAHWSDYDEHSRALQYSSVSDGAELVLEVPEDVHGDLLEHRERQVASGVPNKFGLIFVGPGRRSSVIGRRPFIEAVFSRGFREAGLKPDRRVHRLRHTYASMQAYIGGPDGMGAILAELQRNLGHSLQSTTTDTYVHFYQAAERAPADSFGYLRQLRDAQSRDADDRRERGDAGRRRRETGT